MRKLMVLLSAVLLAASTPGFAGKKGKDKEAVRLEKETKRDEKNLRSYEKVKTYAQDKYASDPDFKDAVDQGYADLLRDHKNIAFEKNTHRNSRVYAVNEDRFRMNDQKELYDNLLVQSRINRIGQNLVPKDSEKMFAFRLTADPTPAADTLSTGTIYISTGMVSLLDNEAQLSYVLAHEMAHVQLDHWKQKVMMQYGVDAFNSDQAKKAEKIAAVGGILGAIGGGFAKGASGAIMGGLAGAAGGAILGALLNRHAVVNWDKAQEDEADKAAFKAMLDAKYDVREVPKLYALMESVAVKDSRVGLGFLGERNRITERKEAAGKLIGDAYKADIEAQLNGGGFKGDSASHRNLMAELKRDNGIMAYYSDMFMIARKNLEEAVAIRDNDPTAQYYYGKVMETIGRTPEDRKLTEQSFVKAAQYDQSQQENFGAHLHRALMMIEDNNTQNPSQLTGELDTYVRDYVRYQIEYAKSQLLPPNINTIAEYMRMYGSADWTPQMPSDAIRVTPAVFPSGPDPAVNKVNAAEPAQQQKGCPPGMVTAAAAAAMLGNRAGAVVTGGCVAAPAVMQQVQPKKK